MKVQKITRDHSLYPPKLLHVAQPPQVLYVLGNIEPLLQKTVVSVVGSRAVTPYGKHITTDLAGGLARRGIAIVSGLALGVDALAHEAALAAGGYTAAILPSNLEEIYPSTNRGLAKRILQGGGALITTYTTNNIAAFKSNFIERNAIVSGLCDGLLITEASEKSGTLHTANFALEQGKTVMCVPGNITSATSKGTNQLIKTGAAVITEASDVLHALELETQLELTTISAANVEEAAILEQMQRGITDVNELQLASNLPAHVFNQTLTMLEISGKVRPLGGGHWAIV